MRALFAAMQQPLRRTPVITTKHIINRSSQPLASMCLLLALCISAHAATNEFRTWTGKNGTALEAKAIAVSPTHVRLQMRSGKTVETDITNLTETDRAFARKLHAAAQNPQPSPSPTRINPTRESIDLIEPIGQTSTHAPDSFGAERQARSLKTSPKNTAHQRQPAQSPSPGFPALRIFVLIMLAVVIIVPVAWLLSFKNINLSDREPKEHILYARHPAMIRGTPSSFLLALLFIPLFGAGFVLLLLLWIRSRSRGLVVTDRRSVLSTGLLSRSTSEVWHSDVRNVRTQSSLLQRVLGSGKVEIASAGMGGIEISVDALADPDHIKKLVNDGRKNIS